MAERNLHQDGKHSREPPYGEANRYHRPEPEECSRYASGMSRIAIRVALGIGALAVGFYVGDWLVWRLARGAPLGVVLVTREVVAPLKSGREEYYYDGTTEERCSRSALAQGGMRPCWWVERHRVIYDR